MPVLLGLAWSSAAIRLVRGLAAATLFLVAAALLVTAAHRRRAAAPGLIAGPPAATGELPVVCLGVFAAAILVYLPAVLATYGFSDDYAGLYLAHNDTRQIQAILRGCGRFINAVLFPFAFAQVETVAELSYLRAFAALGMGLLAVALASFAYRRGWTGPQSAALAFLICTTPSAALTVGWTQLFALPLALLSTLLAYWLQSNIRRTWWWNSLGYAVLAALFLSAAFCIYQPCAMFYLVWLVLDHLPTRKVAQQPGPAAGLRALLIFGLGAAAPYLSIVLQRAPNPRAAPVTNVAAKLSWFVEQPLRNASGLFQLAPATAVSLIVAVVFIVGIICYALRRQRRAACTLAGMLIATPLVYLPNLMIADNWAAYRALFSLAALVIIIAAFALRGVLTHPSVLGGVMVTVAAVAAVICSDQIRRGLIGPQVLELRLTQELLEQRAAEPLTAIHLVQPQWTDCASDFLLYDEFGVATSLHPWTPRYFIWSVARSQAAPEVRALSSLCVTSSQLPLSEARAGVLQLDLRELKNWRQALDWFSPP